MSNELHSDFSHLSEQELVQGCLKDDRQMQEALYRRFAPEMYKVCQRYARDRDEAMEYLQNGFITVFKDIHKFRSEGSLEGWIRRVMVYRSIDLLRKEKRYQEVINQSDEPLYEEAFEYELDQGGTKLQNILGIVNQLPTKAGMVLKLYALEGYTHKEIADILDISVGTSKSQLNRARELVQQAIDKLND